MKKVNTKKLLSLVLVSALMAVSAGCSKDEHKEATQTAESAMSTTEMQKAYDEGMAAYQAGKFSDAVAKFKAPAEQGHGLSQFGLGFLYHQGQGVPQDDKLAVEWLTKAAEQNIGDAQDNLGLRYAKGEGVERDLVQAYKWFSIASMMHKNVAAGSNAQMALSRMTPEQIEQAQNLAKDWMIQHK